MIERYSLPEMKVLWSQDKKYEMWLKVEVAVCKAYARMGVIPADAMERIEKNARFDTHRVDELEREVNHDVIAFLTNMGEYLGDDARYVHLGMTSNDLLDTAQGLIMKEAGEILRRKLDVLMNTLWERAKEFKMTPMMGRTHGVHAEPITMGLKFASWYDEFARNRERLIRATDSVAVGKISGAVGTYAFINPEVERVAMEELGIAPAQISTQVVPRDRHAEFMSTLAVIASSLERCATEIRNLQRTEIGEVQEFFSKTQKGSSAMPHKRNPIMSERVAGLARVVRSNAIAALENVSLWHERDITHSSVERVIIPDSTIALDYILYHFNNIALKLQINAENMLRNIHSTNGVIFSQPVMLAMVEKGMKREDAYRIVQQLAFQAVEGGKQFPDLAAADDRIRSLLSEQELKNRTDVSIFLRNVDHIFKSVGIE